MTYLLFWFGLLALLALWSAGVWALHGLATWAVSGAGELGATVGGLEALVLPAWLAVWLPAEASQGLVGLLTALLPVLGTGLSQLPVLSGSLTVAAWVLWALGAALLILLGLGLSAAVTLWRRRAWRSATGAAVPSMLR